MKPNIILVLLDGSRFDRINTSKAFSEILSKGTLLNNVSTAVPYTFGSLNVIQLTGPTLCSQPPGSAESR